MGHALIYRSVKVLADFWFCRDATFCSSKKPPDNTKTGRDTRFYFDLNMFNGRGKYSSRTKIYKFLDQKYCLLQVEKKNHKDYNEKFR